MIITFSEVHTPTMFVRNDAGTEMYPLPRDIYVAWQRWCFEQWAKYNAEVSFFQGGVAYQFEEK